MERETTLGIALLIEASTAKKEIDKVFIQKGGSRYLMKIMKKEQYQFIYATDIKN